MTQTMQLLKESVPNQEKANELMNHLAQAARPSAVYAEPVTQGEYTVITASEVTIGLGYGYGGGGGVGSEGSQEGPPAESGSGFGAGGGGGGGSTARPVAVIEIGPHGVRVEPVVDPTKIVLAFFTAFGSMFMMLSRMRKAAAE